MKKIYSRPEAEVVTFYSAEEITNNGDDVSSGAEPLAASLEIGGSKSNYDNML